MSTTNPIEEEIYELEIHSDASLSGWEACCRGEKAHGWWSLQEQAKHHINYLELMFYGLKCFANEHRLCEILLRIDNTTAISYINRMGSVQFPKLSSLCRAIWEWCETRDIWVVVFYICSKDNKEADEQSRILPQETEWRLADRAFAELISEFGIDLLAKNSIG